MAKQLKIILKQVPVGLEPTPKQSTQRERFSQAARKCSVTFKDSRLKGAAKVVAMNRWMSEKLNQEITV